MNSESNLKDIFEVWLIYWWVIIVALIAGITSILGRISRNTLDPKPLIIISELFAALLSGTLALLLCIGFGVDFATTGAIVGVAGYMGGKAIDIVVAQLSTRLIRGIK